MQSKSHLFVAVALALLPLCACGRPPADDAGNSAASQKLPFDRQAGSTGVSPSQTLIPSTTKIPEGTSIQIRLQAPLSSASAHAGDTFGATVDEPVVIDGQTLVARGTSATGRVLEAKASVGSRGTPEAVVEPGYLRIVLVSVNVDGKPVVIETSSIFAKGGSRDQRNPASGTASGFAQRAEDIVFGVDRRLNFRLAQTVDLQ